ncbi:hypothetical protein KGY73_05905 [bacterium]|nr:hypothetical protein [bacterium]
MKKIMSFLVCVLILLMGSVLTEAGAAEVEPLSFDHNYTFSEVVDYLNKVIKSYPDITRLHKIGESYEGRDLMVLEVTNQKNGDALDKPGFWIDGNLHSSEVMGAAVCLKTIETLVTEYGKDPEITRLVDTRTVYIMPKLNPDGSDLYLKTPFNLRSSVRPYDSDGDGALDEDPPEDLNEDGYITTMRIKDEKGTMKTHPEDSRLMKRREEDEKGEWRVYREGVDNDGDGRYNEDGVGGLDINRNWPSRWQQEYIQRGAGPYPLSEPETRAVAEFLFDHPNVTGLINHHMAGNFLYRPPTNLWVDPVTGKKMEIPSQDERIYQTFGDKYSEILFDQPVRKVMGRRGPPSYGAIFGVMIGWAYDHLGIFSWVPEMGSLEPFCDYDDDGRVTDLERMRWNEKEMDGRIFVDWEPYDHPELGKVEIGGFVRKLYNPKYESYTNILCTPGPKYKEFLENHTRWNLYLVRMSPLVKITEVKTETLDAGFVRITAGLRNMGFLPTNVTQHAVNNETAKPVKVFLSSNGAELVGGKKEQELGHLPGNTPRSVSPVENLEWVVRTTRESGASVEIKVVSQKGGTVKRKVSLN